MEEKFYSIPEFVPIDSIEPNEYNPNVMPDHVLKRTKKLIERDGFVGAIEVRKHPKKEGKYIIVDGEHRWTVAKEIGYTKIPILLTGKDIEKDAKITTFVRNETKGSPDTIKTAALVHNLLTEHNCTVSELAEEFMMTEQTISQLDSFKDEIPVLPNEDIKEIVKQEESFGRQYNVVLIFNKDQHSIFMEAIEQSEGSNKEEKLINLLV
jgi:ParB/RepB/Spo0J family partition protein